MNFWHSTKPFTKCKNKKKNFSECIAAILMWATQYTFLICLVCFHNDVFFLSIFYKQLLLSDAMFFSFFHTFFLIYFWVINLLLTRTKKGFLCFFRMVRSGLNRTERYIKIYLLVCIPFLKQNYVLIKYYMLLAK